MIGQPIRVELLLERNGFAAFRCLRLLAAGMAFEIGLDIRAESVALDFHDQMFAIDAPEKKIWRVMMPPAILAQILRGGQF